VLVCFLSTAYRKPQTQPAANSSGAGLGPICLKSAGNQLFFLPAVVVNTEKLFQNEKPSCSRGVSYLTCCPDPAGFVGNPRELTCPIHGLSKITDLFWSLNEGNTHTKEGHEPVCTSIYMNFRLFTLHYVNPRFSLGRDFIKSQPSQSSAVHDLTQYRNKLLSN